MPYAIVIDYEPFETPTRRAIRERFQRKIDNAIPFHNEPIVEVTRLSDTELQIITYSNHDLKGYTLDFEGDIEPEDYIRYAMDNFNNWKPEEE